MYEQVESEIKQQKQKFPNTNHTPFEWLPLLIEEIGELSKEVHEDYFTNYYPEDKNRGERAKKEIVQCMAVLKRMYDAI